MVYEFVIPYLYWSRSGGIKNIEAGVKLLEHIRLTSQNRTDFCSTSQPFLSPRLNLLQGIRANFVLATDEIIFHSGCGYQSYTS